MKIGLTALPRRAPFDRIPTGGAAKIQAVSAPLADPAEVAPGLWSWARRHPEWHPGDFGTEVIGYLARAGSETLLIDPLLGGPEDPAWELIDAELGSSLRILISIPYHVRSAEPIRERYRDRAEVSIHGHPDAGSRLDSRDLYEPFSAGDELPGGVSAHAIGSPRRFETPLHLPSHDALLFGDAVVGTGAGPRVWSPAPLDDAKLAFFTERFVPTLEPLLELDFDRLLLTHGPSLTEDGHAGLEVALREPPWYHPG